MVTMGLQLERLDDRGTRMIEIFKEFTFEAAHQLAVNVPNNHPYSRIHGHSFHVKVFLRGNPQPRTGWVTDFAEVDGSIQVIRAQLDHHYLNDIEGLELPTLENISRWIWEQLDKTLPNLDRVLLERKTCNEGCIYSGRAA